MCQMPIRVKICGITNADDCRQATLLGADAIGLNFYPASPRFVDSSLVEEILRDVPPFVDVVGLFVNERLQQVWQLVQRWGRIRTVQWHGENHELGDVAPLQLISAFQVRGVEDLQAITRYLDLRRSRIGPPAAVLVDAHVPGEYGGTGRTAPWELLAEFRPGVPVILAGGLTPENVAEAIRIVQPYAVDVASGVERSPGRKDAEKIRRFVGSAREAAARWT
jgi:phosphoribosylanthranilate isomerase